MNDNTTYREKGRAVFLAAIMVLSVVAMSAAFAGAAAADNPEDEEGLNYAHDGSVAWQGQNVIAYGTAFDDVDEDTDVELRQVESFSDNESSFEAELTTVNASKVDLPDEIDDHDENQSVVEIETDSLDEGYYFLAGEALNTSSSSFTNDDAFEVTTQSFDVEFDDESVTDEGSNANTTVEFDSNRGSYDVNVSADGDLEYEDLESIFAPGDFDEIANYSGDDDDVITLEDVQDDEYDISFDGIDTGDYDFDFEVDDTEAEASASITVEELDVSGSFSQGVYTQTAGDIVEITLELDDTDDAYIQIGDEDAGFVDVVYVEDDEDDGEVSFKVNTRLLGATEVDGNDVYDAGDDDIESVVHDDLAVSTDDDTTDEGVNFYEEDAVEDEVISFETYLDNLGIKNDNNGTEQLTRPLQPTDYSLIADAQGDFIVDDGESSADNEIDAATLDLLEPGIDGITTYVAPSDDANEDDELEDLNDVITERTEVAEDDRLIIEAETSGIFGALAAHSDDDMSIIEDGSSAAPLNELVNDADEGVNFEVEADDGIGNQEPTSLDLENDDEEDIFLLIDNDEGVLYVVVNTDGDAFEGDLEDGQTFDVTLEYETDEDDRYAFDSSGVWNESSYESFPYFGTDSDQSVSTEFDIVEPEAEFDNLDADDNVQIEAGEEVALTGETNVAPGSEGDVRVSNAGDTPSFLSTEDIEINSDGTFETESFDFADRDVDDEAELEFRVGGSTISDADGIFVESVDEEPVEEDDDEPVDADDDEPVDTDDDEPVDTDDDAPVDTGDDDEPVDTEEDGVPGFGLAIAVVALLAAAMLALRRQN